MCHIPAHNALYPTLHRRQPYKFAPVQVCDPDLSIAMPLAKWRIKLLAAVCTAVAVLLVVSLFSSIPTEETEYSTSGSTVTKMELSAQKWDVHWHCHIRTR